MSVGRPATYIQRFTRYRPNSAFQCQFRSPLPETAQILGHQYSTYNYRHLTLTPARPSENNALFVHARRLFSVSPIIRHGHLAPPKAGEELHITFVDKEGDEHIFEVAKGDNLLDIAQSEELEMEGACGGSCACSTCHVIVESQDKYDAMPEPDDDENDMLDLAFGLTETSRLGCQVRMTPELDGMKVRLPSMTRNLQKSDFEGGKKV